MTAGHDFTDVVSVLERYFDGLYHADRKRLADVFHPDARYVNIVEGDYMNFSVSEYFDIVDRRTPPASDGQVRNDQIVSIEYGGTRMAFAKVTMSMMGRDYLDFLTLTRHGNEWRIMSKVFSYAPNAQEA